MQPQEEYPAEVARRAPGVAVILAALAFAYCLVATLGLLMVEGFFSGQDNQRTVLLWLLLPLVATFLAWMAVSSPNRYLRITVWFLVLAVLFFCWLSIFSIGVYFLPAPLLMVMSVLGPWDGPAEES